VSAKDLVLPYYLTARRLCRDWPTAAELAWSRERSFSQFGEDLFLARHFERQSTGFYVDVGALHPFQFSNTYLLYNRGWRGINIEPSPDGAAAFRRYRPDDINLDVAIASAEGEARYRLAGAFAGIDDEQLASRAVPAGTITVTTRTLASVLDEHAAARSIDLLDVDCEGRDLDVLRSNDWDRHRPRLILAEAHTENAHEQISHFLAGTGGYRLLTRLALTLVFELPGRHESA
jgi:FkbM family methyltransferase